MIVQCKLLENVDICSLLAITGVWRLEERTTSISPFSLKGSTQRETRVGCTFLKRNFLSLSFLNMASKSLLLCALALFAVIAVAHATQKASFPVHRLLQSSVDATQFGSQKAAVSMSGSTLESSSGVSGTMLVLKVDAVDLTKLKQVREARIPTFSRN